MSKWKCPKCHREFEKKNQTHSCTYYPLEKHFEGKKEVAKPLYNALKKKIKQDVGPLKIESLPCCIHLLSDHTFGAVFAFKNKIRIHFTLDHKIKNKRIDRWSQPPKNRYMYSVEFKEAKEIDKELLSWLKIAYNMKKNGPKMP